MRGDTGNTACPRACRCSTSSPSARSTAIGRAEPWRASTVSSSARPATSWATRRWVSRVPVVSRTHSWCSLPPQSIPANAGHSRAGRSDTRCPFGGTVDSGPFPFGRSSRCSWHDSHWPIEERPPPGGTGLPLDLDGSRCQGPLPVVEVDQREPPATVDVDG